jgi:hypothetical protein
MVRSGRFDGGARVMGRSTGARLEAGAARGIVPRLGARSVIAPLVMVGAMVNALFGGVATAQTAVEMAPLAAAYGSAVHAFYAGDYERSHELLTTAIDAGIEDPRAWYFRGLSALRLGRSDEAEMDFTEGAERESSRVGRWPVSRSLERVQGTDRLRLERHRVRARVAALQRDREAFRRRYSELDEAQPEVLRSRVPATPRRDTGSPFGDEVAPETIPTPPEPGADAATPPEPAAAPIELEADPFAN